MPKTATPTYIEVDQTVADAFDEYCKASERCKELDRQRRPHHTTKRDLLDVLKTAITDPNTRAVLPDGREITREDIPRHRKAQPPSDYTIVNFREVSPDPTT